MAQFDFKFTPKKIKVSKQTLETYLPDENGIEIELPDYESDGFLAALHFLSNSNKRIQKEIDSLNNLQQG